MSIKTRRSRECTSALRARSSVWTETPVQCGLMRNTDGTVGLADTGPATAGLQSGTWTFTPDPGAMILVPDQDWLVYGAWLTTPDVEVGTHRVGVFFNGMDMYANEGKQRLRLLAMPTAWTAPQPIAAGRPASMWTVPNRACSPPMRA